MTEVKFLLLKDLCARLPYGVVCVLSEPPYGEITEPLRIGGLRAFMEGKWNIKPYLRPMSSMTEEEIEELDNLLDKELKDSEPYFVYEQLTVDFYLRHHLDNRLMIEKELALPAPEGMYNLK